METYSPVIKDDATLYNTVEQIGLGWVSGRYFSVSFKSVLFVMFLSYILFVSYYYFNRWLIPRMCNISSLMVMDMFVYEPGAGCKGVPSEEQDENGEDLHLSRSQSNFSRIQCIPFGAVSSVHAGEFQSLPKMEVIDEKPQSLRLA